MQIIKEVQRAFGRDIQYVKDCEELSNEILELTRRKVSSSTLRRAFGLLNSASKRSKFTEDTLLQYITQKSALQKEVINNDLSLTRDKIDLDFLNLKQLHGGLTDDFFKELEGANFHPNKTFKFLHLAIMQAIEEEDLDFFFTLYRQSKIILSSRRLFRFLGTQLKANKSFADRLLPKLAKDKNARRYFFELFVDFGNFRTYKKWLEIYYESEPKYLNKLWALSLILYGNQLSNTKQNQWEEFFELVEICFDEIQTAHPYLKARIYGVLLFHEDTKELYNRKIIEELKSELSQLEMDKTYHPYFPQMILQYIILFNPTSENIILLHKILKTYKELNFTTEEYGIPFYIGVCECLLNNSQLNLIEIETFYSGHTNEDTALKLFTLRFLGEDNNHSEVIRYKKKLINESGFEYFK